MKIFQIGFNRCGTVSLWQYFKSCGIPAVHWERGDLARSIYFQHTWNTKLLDNYRDTMFFSDMESDVIINGKPSWIYAHVDYYKLLDQQYPGSKFILNTRNVDDWIKSRSWFEINPGAPKTEYLEYAKLIHNTDTDGIYKIWTKQWNDHHADVINYFKNRPEDLLIYDIDTDNTSKLINFFKDTLVLKDVQLLKLNSGKS
jgi:hypothetical protein